MAVFKLGAIITDIAGSVGGTTFRRGAGLRSMYNKSGGGPKSKLLQNQQLQGIAAIWKRWSLLSGATRTAWDAAALLFEFPDKFGVMRNLTGRQLFSKLNIQLLPVGSSISDPTGITSFIEPFTIIGSTVSSDQDYASVIINTASGENNYMISAEIKQGEIYKPTFTSRKVFFFSLASGIEELDITDDFYFNFPQFGVGYQAMYYITAINAFGFKSVTAYSLADVDPD